jgi:hypothetical protein
VRLPRARGIGTGLWQRGRAAKGQHRDARGFEPGKPSQPSRFGPKGKRAGFAEETAERLERGHRLQVNRNLFGIAGWRLAMHDFDVETRQPRRCPGGVALARL